MNAPFFTHGYFGYETSLVVAVVIGIGFGFFLEQAGFGSARKLVSQFYLTDLTVFKVMFGAIVTAMLGLFYLGWIGFLDLSQIYLSPTYLVPQTIGGLILGAGFVIGGYCPGTSVVAIATGRLDALFFFLGVAGGIFAFGEVFPAIEGFFYSTARGKVTLPEAFHLSHGLVVFGIVVIAVAGFRLATFVERRFGAIEGRATA